MMKLKFKTIYLFTGILPMLLVTAILGLYSSKMIKTEVSNVQVEKLEASAYELSEYFSQEIGKDGKLDYEKYADHSYVQQLAHMGIELTLFEKDTRFITSLKNANGSYNEGTKANADIWATVSRGNDYSEENIEIGGKKYFVYYTPVYSDKDHKEIWGMAFAGVPMDDVHKVITDAVMSTLIIAIVSVVVILVVLLIIASVFTKTMKKIGARVKKFASGDISAQEEMTSRCKEFDELCDCLDILQKELGGAIIAIKNTSVNLGNAVQKVDSLSVESADGATLISGTINQLADTAQSMAESVQTANVSMITIGDAISNISESVSLASKRAEQMRIENERAMENMRDVYNSSEKSVNLIMQINDQTTACTAAVESIKSAAGMISDIASQTNLLALNASIESARAGELGKGFAVVADNIRTLAEQSDESVREIQKSVMDVVAKVDACADMALNAKTQMEEQQSLVKSVSMGMNQLSENVVNVANDITAVSDEVMALDEAKGVVLGNITELSAISEENAASAEEVSATIETITDGIAGTKDESGHMRNMAEDLSQKISYFA